MLIKIKIDKMNSPLNQFGSIASVLSEGFLNQQQQGTVDSKANSSIDAAKSAAVGGFGAKSMLDTLNQKDSATSTISGALAGATPDAGMLSNPSPQNDNSSDVEGRISALEQSISSNTLGNAKPVFNAQSQQAAQGIYGQQQVPGTFDRSLDPTAAAPLMKKRKY